MNAQVETIVEGLKYPEGLYFSSRDQCIYFVEWSGDRILAYREGKTWLVYQAQPGSGPCGLSQDPDGNLWACFYSACQIVQIDPAGELLQVYNDWRGQYFTGPNDLIHAPDGGLFFTDSGNFQEDWITGQLAGSVYYLGSKGDLSCAATGIAYSNGIAISLDGHRLFVSEHRRNRILLFDIEEAGILLNRRVFADLDNDCVLDPGRVYELGPDGLCLDWRGWLWVAHYGGGKLIGLNKDGEPMAVIHLPEGRCPTNLAFHPREKAFYITEAEYGTLLRCEL
jgi:gluconolactonase